MDEHEQALRDFERKFGDNIHKHILDFCASRSSLTETALSRASGTAASSSYRRS